MKRFLAFTLVLWLVFAAKSQLPMDSMQVSLLTCSPGTEVYSLYGHTALRCRNITRNQDLVYNYGVFSFQQPHFVWRFILGECDYMVQPVPWPYFIKEYGERGSTVTEQVLNFSSIEANRLAMLLYVNSLPENCQYRYNFLYNNCTTKVRDMIERAADGTLEYPQFDEKKTYRQILHEYTAVDPWASEGNDLLLGQDVDTLLTDRAAMFAPEYMMNYAEDALIRAENNDYRQLVKKTYIHNPLKPSPEVETLPFTPIQFSATLLIFALLVVGVEYKFHFMWWGWDVMLMLIQGLAGCLLVFMFLFSEHPGVGSNWLVLLLNPLPLFALPKVVKSAYKRQTTRWHSLNFAILTLFIVFSVWIPQDFGDIVVPLALVLLTRPISYNLYFRKKVQPSKRKIAEK